MNAMSPIEAAEAGALLLTWDGDRAVFAKAFVAAQKAMEAVKKASSNPAFKSKYADLSEVVEAVVPALNNAGIGVMQFPAFDGEMAAVTTIFLHESGASVTGILHLRPSKLDPQGAGSAFTYGRRYSLMAMSGVAPEDDDGNAASGPREAREHHRETSPPKESVAVGAAKVGIDMCKTIDDLKKWKKDHETAIQAFAPDDADAVVRHMNDHLAALKNIAAASPGSTNSAQTKPNDFGLNGDEIPNFG